MTECWIGTRKGLIGLSRDGNDSWKLSAPLFPGEPVTMVLPDNGTGTMYAALNLGHFGPKLHRSTDDGKTWEECVPPAFPRQKGDAAEGENGEGTGTGDSVQLIWILEHGKAGEIWAGTMPAGLFRSRDRGLSWEIIDSLTDRPEAGEWFGGGYDHPGIHSIMIDPRDPDRITIAISCGGVWFSGDGGITWQNKAQGMRAEYLPPEQAGNPNTQDPHRLLPCPAHPDRLWVQHHNGIFRFDEADGRWQEILEVSPSAFGFALAVHPTEKDTAWFVPAVKDECRMPVNNRLVVNRTRDGGRSFTALTAGLPQTDSYDLIYRHCLDLSADGLTLMMGSTSGNLWVSNDQGDNWRCLATFLPPVYCVRFVA